MRKSAEISVSVVIPTWNAAADVARVLECLADQQGVLFEVLVVDNGVVNRDTEVVCEGFLRRLPYLRYLRFEKQLGYAGAVNQGAAAASSDIVAVINNDNLPEPDWLAELLKEYGRRKASGREAIISSMVDRPDFPDPLGARSNIWGRIVRVPRSGGVYSPFHPDGSAFLFSRKIFGPPYDPDYFIYHEDVALGWRAWLMGHEVVVAEGAKAKTFDGGATRRIRYLTAFYTERNRWLNYFVFLSLSSILRLLPLLWLDATVKFVGGSHRKAKFHAWAWLLYHPIIIWKKRRAIQRMRIREDAEVLSLLSFKYADPPSLAARLNFFMDIYLRLVGLLPSGRTEREVIR